LNTISSDYFIKGRILSLFDLNLATIEVLPLQDGVALQPMGEGGDFY
jgi:hypothetical protein